MGLAEDLQSTFGGHPLSRIYLVNLFEHCSVGHLPAAEIASVLGEATHRPSVGFDDYDDGVDIAYEEARALIHRFRNLSQSISVLSVGAIRPDPISHCTLVRVYKRKDFEKYVRAHLTAARLPGYTPPPFTAGDVRAQWLTQDHDLIFRNRLSADPDLFSAEAVVARLGLIHFWGNPEEVCFVHMNCASLASDGKRPTAIDGDSNPAYLAVSMGEKFNRALPLPAPTSTSSYIPEFARTLDLAGVEGRQELIDGGIEFIVDLSASRVAETIKGDVTVVGPLDVSSTRASEMLTLIDWIRCPDEKMSQVYKGFEDALPTS